MRTKTYAFKPKGKGYTVYATRTYHGNSARSNQSHRSGGMGEAMLGMALKGIFRSLRGRKR